MKGPVRSALCEQEPRQRLAQLAEGVSGQRPALVRFDCLLDDVDPWALVLDPATGKARLGGSAEPWMLWDDPRDGTRFAALGCVREVASTGDGDGNPVFFDAQAGWQQVACRLHSLGDPAGFEQLPILLGGFAFDAAAVRPTGPWQGWPACRLWLPRVLVAYMHGRVTATVFAELADPAGADAVHAELCAQADLIDACVAGYGAVWSSSMVPPPGYQAAATDAEQTPANTTADAAWLATVEAARQYVQQGKAAKLVVARAEEQTSQGFDALGTAVALRVQQPGCVTYALQADGAAFVGATPETLLRLGGRLAESQALAGTSHGDDTELAARTKDRHEQQLVVDAITAALAPFATNVEADGEPQLARFADVHHLSTRIHAWLERELDAFTLLAALHPTPAVNGHPQDVARDWLREHEKLQRGYFAGPVGWVNPLGDGTWVVALRCALIRGTTAWTYAGAGVVAESDPQAEWAETNWKMRAAKAALQAAPMLVKPQQPQSTKAPE